MVFRRAAIAYAKVDDRPDSQGTLPRIDLPLASSSVSLSAVSRALVIT
jgi:hypothetical protein